MRRQSPSLSASPEPPLLSSQPASGTGLSGEYLSLHTRPASFAGPPTSSRLSMAVGSTGRHTRTEEALQYGPRQHAEHAMSRAHSTSSTFAASNPPAPNTTKGLVGLAGPAGPAGPPGGPREPGDPDPSSSRPSLRTQLLYASTSAVPSSSLSLRPEDSSSVLPPTEPATGEYYGHPRPRSSPRRVRSADRKRLSSSASSGVPDTYFDARGGHGGPSSTTTTTTTTTTTSSSRAKDIMPSPPLNSSQKLLQRASVYPDQQMASSVSAAALGPTSATASTGQPPGEGQALGQAQPSNMSTRSSKHTQPCARCDQPMTGQFVRALGAVFHLDCFRCQDCNKVVAAKFFPVDGPDGRQYPLCETDYFRRLSLICAKCGAALRGSYITALDMKFHIEHFTCSVCPTVFGPQDSYYEHGGQVYCHFHYSTRFAVKCTGCKTAILKQFVEINRNNVDEHWHPECYMIHKFWNIKLVPTKKSVEPAPPENPDDATSASISSNVPSSTSVPDWNIQESSETPQTLREKQKHVEAQVYRIWTVLSTFEESSAACISEMLRHVSNGHYLDGVKMAEKFILHVETLFSAIDDLNSTFKNIGGKEIPHVREARMLCKKIVNFFSLLSHTHESGARKMGITQDLLSLVTGLAHYLKILIRIALTAALKLERDHSSKSALSQFLNRLDRLCKDLDSLKSPLSVQSHDFVGQGTVVTEAVKARPYGYKSLLRPGGTFIGQGESLSDLCEGCRLTVEEECVRFGDGQRWHLACLSCSVCRRHASKDPHLMGIDHGQKAAVPLRDLRLDPSEQQMEAPTKQLHHTPCVICTQCASSQRVVQDGFEYVTRLEQYAFLLCVALNKLYRLLRQRGVVPGSPNDGSQPDQSPQSDERSLHEAYRDSMEIKRMKTVNLDRKISTSARVAQRLTVVEGPSSRAVQANDISSYKVDDSRLGGASGTSPTLAPLSAPISLPSQKQATPRDLLQQPQSRQSPPHLHQPFQTLAIRQQNQFGNESEASPYRPPFNRSTTAVRVVEDQPAFEHQEPRETGLLGSDLSPVQDEDGITLADLHQVMEAEQAREQHRPLPRNSQTQLLSELSALEYFIVKHAAAITLASDVTPFRDFAELDELLDIIDAKKNNFWGKLFKGGGGGKKEVKKKGVFGVPLEVLVERHGADSMLGAGPGSVRVPLFIDDAITAMKQMDMSVEGIFRKNGNIRRLKELADAMDRDPESVNLQDDNPVQVAALLKKFLRDLPEPLLTFRLQHLWLATQKIESESDRKKVLHLICCLMPKCHRDTMEVLFVFLKWVASFSHIDEETGSKMDLQNLATVICPNILYSKGKDPTKDESFLGIRAVADLLTWQDEMFTVPQELLAILSDQDLFLNPAELSSKDILKKAEQYLRERQRNQESAHGGEPNYALRNGHRGEVKHTHPRYHAGFAPTQYQPTLGQNGAPSANGPDRPLSWQKQTSPYQPFLGPHLEAQSQPQSQFQHRSPGPSPRLQS